MERRGTQEFSQPLLTLFVVSVIGLYLEMLLIRWIGTEVSIFAYLQNTVLVVCFLGLGMGCFISERPILPHRTLYPLTALVLLLSIPQTQAFLRNISLMLSALGDLVVWDEFITRTSFETFGSITLGLLATFILMLMLWEVFVPLGQLLGRLLETHPRPILAYSVNVAGSLAGIWLFVLLTVFFVPPFGWFVILVCLFLVLALLWPHVRTWGNLSPLAVLLGLSAYSMVSSDALETLWSPYQKIAIYEAPADNLSFSHGVRVNNYPFHGIARPVNSLDYNDSRILYDLPLLLHPQTEKMLIVGSGGGNDIVGALRNGVDEVVAVEIDPAVIALGSRYNESKPYQHERVRVVNDDARSYFASSEERFDLVLLALLDSHTTNAMTNARLDHYVYTREGLEKAKELLNESGVMVLTFFARRDYIADRIGAVLRDVWGASPLYFRMPMGDEEIGGVVFVVGNTEAVNRQLETNAQLRTLVENWRRRFPLELTYTTRVTTDDWPYLYLAEASIPALYYLLTMMTLCLALYARRRLALPQLSFRWNRTHWHFALLGAAFLLLEVQNISKSYVILGNTWTVNAIVISGVLLMVLAANAITAIFSRLPVRAAGILLVGSSIALYFVDLAQFASLPYSLRVLVVGGLTTLPMLFSGVVFVSSFAKTPRKDLALGANLFGSLVGALLQSMTFVTGMKFLLLVVAALYTTALIFSPKAEEVRT